MDQSTVTSSNVRTKVNLNPFGHFAKGNKLLFKTNPGVAIGIAFLNLVVSFGISTLFILLLGKFISDGVIGITSSVSSLLGKLLVGLVVAILVNSYFAELEARAVLTASRGQKVSFGSLFPFVAKRFWLIVLAYLIIIAVFIGYAIVVGILSSVSNALGVLVGIVGAVALLVFVLRVCYTPLVSVDDEQPASAVGILKGSAALWKKSAGALVLYVLTLIVVALVASALFGGSATKRTTEVSNPNPYDNRYSLAVNSNTVTDYGGLFVSSLVSTIIGIAFLAGLANIYNEAKDIADGNTSPVAPLNPPSANPQPLV